jgi:hypothetical protein
MRKTRTLEKPCSIVLVTERIGKFVMPTNGEGLRDAVAVMEHINLLVHLDNAMTEIPNSRL